MWQDAGLLRDAAGLARALACLRGLREQVKQGGTGVPATRAAAELRNLLDIAELIVRSAQAREESRGAHFRNDFPTRNDDRFAQHSLAIGNDAIAFAPRSL